MAAVDESMRPSSISNSLVRIVSEDVELAGVHYCLGANLARLEIAEALKVVTRRISNPRRTGPAPWKPILGLSRPTSLPIAFDA
jgi:hypothetical protein